MSVPHEDPDYLAAVARQRVLAAQHGQAEHNWARNQGLMGEAKVMMELREGEHRNTPQRAFEYRQYGRQYRDAAEQHPSLTAERVAA